MNQRKSAGRLALLVVSLALAISAASCKKTEPAKLASSKIHAISKELSNAARTSAPSGSVIRIALQASDPDPKSVDRLDINLHSNGPDSPEQEKIVGVQQSLSAVATRHGLTVEPSESSEGFLFYYLKSGIRTHVIHIHTDSKPSQRASDGASAARPKLAIILDDLGSDRTAADAIFALPYPLTLSILPHHEHSAEIAEEAEGRGYQVMLHLPMQSVANEKPEAQELHSGMPAAEVSALVQEFLQNVPGARGVNNHQGSQATSDTGLMSELMPILGEHHLFYIDSRTSAATVAYDTAQNLGVPSAFRNVPFLDDLDQVTAVRKQLDLALRGAREKGEAVAIGHARPATLQALREILPQAQQQGVRLVFASELTH